MIDKKNTNKTIILKTEEELQALRIHFAKSLNAIQKLQFWKTHFSNHNFYFDPKKFSWEYWQTIPFSTLEDISEIGLNTLLFDIEGIIKKVIYKYSLYIRN